MYKSNHSGAVMSEKIIVLMAHVKRFTKDAKAGRSLTYLIQKRRNMLDYLQRTDYHYFKWVCTDYGIPE
jgi:small subunit ribosomal protein S15